MGSVQSAFEGSAHKHIPKGTVFAADDWRGSTINENNLDRTEALRCYLQALAKEKEATVTQISLAWVLNKNRISCLFPE